MNIKDVDSSTKGRQFAQRTQRCSEHYYMKTERDKEKLKVQCEREREGRLEPG